SLKTAENSFKRGRAYVDSQNWEDAINELTQAVTIYPNHVEANYLLGKAYMNRGLLQHNDNDFQYSDLYIDRCLQLSPLHQGALAVKSQKRKGMEQHSSVESRSKRNQKLIAAAVFAGLLLFFAFMYIHITNTMAAREEQVNQAWAQVENVYQRRADLIPNLVKTVQAAANFEKETLLAVQKARSEASAVKLDLSHFDQAQFEEFVKKQQALGMAMNRLMAVAENYPQLRTSENFLALQDELEGSENRISVERKRFNEAVQAYNSKCRRFPYSFSDCQPKPYFKADQGASQAPDIDLR
ncbi:MAG TPA: LemA family protein, partial [Thermodesulfovibrionia bacterium]|nr:LemA family protein [Thermodesulfovibrionia bacterium]